MASFQEVTREQVLQALSTVQDPDLKRDLVSLGMIQGVEISGGEVFFRVILTTPACPLKAQIERECREAVAKIPGVSRIRVEMGAQVRRKEAQGSTPIKGVTHVIAVSSGKGGVGKSTVAVNLAVSLSLEGAKVGLMDVDVYGPNTPTMMGVLDQPRIENQDGPQGSKEMFIPPRAHGIPVMSMGMLVQGDQPMVWRGPMLHSVVNQFCHQVQWGELDYLVVDMPPGTGDVQLSLAQLVPVTGAVLVSTPQEVSMQDVRKAFHMFEKVRIPTLGIVENMSYFKCDGCDKKHTLFGEGGGELLSRKLGAPLLAQLPLQPEIREGGDSGKPIVLRNPESEVAMSFRALARSVAQRVSMIAGAPGPELIQIGRFN